MMETGGALGYSIKTMKKTTPRPVDTYVYRAQTRHLLGQQETRFTFQSRLTSRTTKS